MVWACFKASHKWLLIFWDRENWGRTVAAASFTVHIVPQFYHFWKQESQPQPCSNSDSDSDTDLLSDYVQYLQQDSAALHRAALTQNHLCKLGIWSYFIDWPPCSPDCSPIENIWRVMKQRVRQQEPFPTTNQTLRFTIQKEWSAVTQGELSDLVDTVPTRVREVTFFFLIGLASYILTTQKLTC